MRLRDILLVAWELPQSTLRLALFGVQTPRGRVERMRLDRGRVFVVLHKKLRGAAGRSTTTASPRTGPIASVASTNRCVRLPDARLRPPARVSRA